MPYIKVRGCWCDVIVLSAQAPNEDKTDNRSSRNYFIARLKDSHAT